MSDICLLYIWRIYFNTIYLRCNYNNKRYNSYDNTEIQQKRDHERSAQAL